MACWLLAWHIIGSRDNRYRTPVQMGRGGDIPLRLNVRLSGIIE